MSAIKQKDIKFPIHIGPVYPCLFCKTNFINLYFLSKHSIKCLSNVIQIIDQGKFDFLIKHWKKDEAIQSTKNPFKCEICMKQFNSKYRLTRHLNIHSGIKPFKCYICEKEFNSNYHLTRHLNVHSGKKSSKRDISPEQFIENSTGTRHLNIHSGKKVFKCEICAKQFNSKYRLTRHFYIHSGIKPFKCYICGKEFSVNYHLTRHLNVHFAKSTITTENKSSVILPSLNDDEKEFFDLVLNGQIADIQEFLYSHPNLDINCQNYQGISAIHLAVASGNSPLVEFLASLPGIDLGDSVLHAIRQNDQDLTIFLLDALKQISPNLEFAGAILSPEFPEGMTPLMLAAHCGHFELIGILLKRGHWVERPHRARCVCTQCKATEEVEDRLGVASARLNAYRTWANPSFLCHITDDPILIAFELCRDLKEWAHSCLEFRIAFTDLAIECRIFAVKLLACCRNAFEVRTVLNRSEGCPSGRRLKYPRLVLAIDLIQKEFVAHPNAQNVVDAAWIGSYTSWRRLPGWAKGLAFLARFFTLPFLVVVCTLMPDTRRGRHWAVPINKFISSTVTYLLFLIFIFIECNQDKSHQPRGPPNTGIEALIILFVLSYIWGLFRLLIIHGPRRFFSTMLNVYDSITQLLFLITFFFWAASWADVVANDQVQLERKFWHKHDPTLIAEGLFTLAAILAYGRLLVMLQFNYYLGPLQVALGKMGKDMLKFVILFFFLILAFSVGLARLYQYYEGMTQLDHETGTHTQQVESFVSFSATLKTLFWAIFCMAPLESADVIIENLPGESPESSIINQHNFTETIGYICFALFEVLSVIVILNMLIATMANTFQKVTDNVGVEWTFGRTKLHMLFFEQTALPPPFNLIPTVKGMAQVLQWIQRLFAPTDMKNERLTLADCCYTEPFEQEESDKDFSTLMSILIQRYMRYAAEGDFEMLESAVLRPMPSLQISSPFRKSEK